MRWPMWPKVVQINQRDIHILGGNNNCIETQYEAYVVLDLNFKTSIDP